MSKGPGAMQDHESLTNFAMFFGVLPGVLAVAVICLACCAVREAYRKHRGDRRAREGCCPACGYRTEHSRDRCSECGFPILK
jgi:uncharacterized paraquat-inducible protein A